MACQFGIFPLTGLATAWMGTPARFRKIERPKYGFFIDHTIDTISEMAIFIGIGLSPYADLTLALLALIGYLCMANLVYITTSVQGVFKISYGKLGPTEVRVIAMLSNAAVFFLGNPKLTLPVANITLTLYNLIIIFIIGLLAFFSPILSSLKPSNLSAMTEKNGSKLQASEKSK